MHSIAPMQVFVGGESMVLISRFIGLKMSKQWAFRFSLGNGLLALNDRSYLVTPCDPLTNAKNDALDERNRAQPSLVSLCADKEGLLL